ncbi:sensor domain-containing protein [Sulfurospirillum oryzae]|uniref:sensor domain-containing protein n=1 Tax=Sulfurospirillum oryzae TaxID=2976535 RepID=UPI0021E70400|nr:EAL domain-containing protein [Sulfurospirillum oryzae]
MSAKDDDFEQYLNLSPTVFFKWRAQDGWPIEYVSKNVLTLLGYSKEEFMSQAILYSDLIHPLDLAKISNDLAQFVRAQKSFKHSHYRLISKSKKIIWVEDSTQIVRDENGDILHYFGYICDITSLKTSNQNLEMYKHILNANNIITLSDKQGNITYANDLFLQSSGYTLEEIIGKPHNILRHPDTSSEVFKTMWHCIQNKQSWKGILKNKKKDGTPFYADVFIAPLLDEHQEIEQYIGVRHDITELIETSEALTKQSQTDNLTGLGNRFKLLQNIQEAHHPLLALFDIGRFSEINDFYGYALGDELICAFARKLHAFTRPQFQLYRINADEFAILYDSVQNDEFLTTIQTIHSILNSEPLHVKNKTIVISVTTSLSFESKKSLLTTADIAKNHAKNTKMLFCLYNKEIELAREYERNIYWASKIKQALDEGKVTAFFQPIFNNKTQKIEKYEALVRIVDGDKIIAPAHFLDIAKKTHQYIDITKRVIDASFKLFETNNLDFSINLTHEDILSDELKHHLWQGIHTYSMEGRLILEIVESEGLKDSTAIKTFLSHAKASGCRLAIDDFGTGYSNFEYLITLGATYIKIDGSIIQKIHANNGAMDVIKAIITFAKARGMQTVAEFVSSKEIFDTVCELGIDYSQGYYIGEPKAHLLY